MLARLKASATKPGFDIPSDDATAASATKPGFGIPSDATAASDTKPGFDFPSDATAASDTQPWVLLYTTTPPVERLEGGLSAGSAAGHREDADDASEVAMDVERSLSTMPDDTSEITAFTDMTIAMDVERCMVTPTAPPPKRSFNHRDVHEEMTEIFHDVYQRHGGNSLTSGDMVRTVNDQLGDTLLNTKCELLGLLAETTQVYQGCVDIYRGECPETALFVEKVSELQKQCETVRKVSVVDLIELSSMLPRVNEWRQVGSLLQYGSFSDESRIHTWRFYRLRSLLDSFCDYHNRHSSCIQRLVDQAYAI
ncbi:hypothetical protein T484DRAFT_1860439 [Baffinella frigidus]|nr:hypothetical protein T484DRAFT_1860439 [Cryptophyta sp. CCMP2293]